MSLSIIVNNIFTQAITMKTFYSEEVQTAQDFEHYYDPAIWWLVMGKNKNECSFDYLWKHYLSKDLWELNVEHTEDGEIPEDEYYTDEKCYKILQRIWNIVNMSGRDFLISTGMSTPEISIRFFIPIRTIENWKAKDGSAEHREMPWNVRYMMSEILGYFDFERDFAFDE